MSLMVSLSHSEGLGVDGLKLRYNIPNFLTGMKPQEASDHEVHSSASCTMLRLDGNKYWRDYGSDSQTFKGMSYKPYGRAPTEDIKFTKILEIDWKDEGNGEAIAEALRVLDHKSAWPRHGAEQVTWAAPLVGGSNGSSVTCEDPIIHVSVILPRTNVLFPRCGISRNRLGMHIKPV